MQRKRGFRGRFIPCLRDSLTKSVQEQSCQYPVLPIKDVMNALFLFSDIPLSDYVLDKMETDTSYRQPLCKNQFN